MNNEKEIKDGSYRLSKSPEGGVSRDIYIQGHWYSPVQLSGMLTADLKMLISFLDDENKIRHVVKKVQSEALEAYAENLIAKLT